MNNALISVIVPVYNVEKYLSQCVYSIINQTYKNIEIILIDDGSTDNSGMLCDKFSDTWVNVRTIHTDNHGLSAARNVGLSNAKGEYIGFVDSDDWVDENMYKELYNIMMFNHSQLSCTGIIDEYTDIPTKTKLTKNVYKADKKSAFDLIITDKNIYGYVCNKLFKKSIIEDLTFDEQLLSCEDLVFTIKYAQKCDILSYTYNQLYHYRQRPDSMTGNVNYNVRKLSVLDAYEQIMPIYEMNNCDVIGIIKKNYLKININIKGRMKLSKVYNNAVLNRLNSNIEKYFFVVLKDKSIPKSTKLNIILSNKFPGLLLKIKQNIQKY